MNIQKKLIPFGEVKFAADDETETRTFSGYGAVFNNVDSYGDVLAPGAFSKTLKSGPAPLMFLNHALFSLPIGKWTSFEEDEFGLKVEGEFLDTTTGIDAYKAAKAGAITGLSIGYIPREVKLGKGPDEPARLLKTVDLIEVSVVTIPANPEARIANVKSFEDITEFERELIERGFHSEEAKTFIANLSLKAETKYIQAAEMVSLEKLLSTIQGAK